MQWTVSLQNGRGEGSLSFIAGCPEFLLRSPGDSREPQGAQPPTPHLPQTVAEDRGDGIGCVPRSKEVTHVTFPPRLGFDQAKGRGRNRILLLRLLLQRKRARLLDQLDDDDVRCLPNIHTGPPSSVAAAPRSALPPPSFVIRMLFGAAAHAVDTSAGSVGFHQDGGGHLISSGPPAVVTAHEDGP